MENTSHTPVNARVTAVLVAAGRGERAGQSVEGPKQYRTIGGAPVIAHTIKAFLSHPQIASVVVAIHPDDEELFRRAAPIAENLRFVFGGLTRQESVRLALEAAGEDKPQTILIHDAVRPFVDHDLIDRVIATAQEGSGALPALAVSDTLKRGSNGIVEGTVSRDGLYAAQTPQGFPYQPILDAHRAAADAGRSDFTDDAAIAEWAGLTVRLVEGSPDNVKITWARDIAIADQRIRMMSTTFPDVRTGNGYDVHSFGEGDHVTLCGVKIPFDKGLSGHSDADVGLHALTDALLATKGLGDIGTHFPPSDQQWRGAASRIFVEHAAKLVREHGGRIANVDITLICEAPKVGPHREAMTAELCDMLGISADRVSIKATTNEKLGFLGRGEGIAAIATASVVYPGSLPE